MPCSGQNSDLGPPFSPNTGEVLVSVDRVSKKFCRSLKTSLLYGVRDIAAELAPLPRGARQSSKNHPATLRPKEFWAVDGVSFELRRGECMGLIGHNGAGKTTLLKMLNGLIKPDDGRIEMRGRVGGLIALGAAFNPILTGRENIRVNASVLGIRQREANRIMDEIIEFAEVGDYIDMPVQNYSSGMTVRLGFAVAIKMNPDILLIDEVLAVGDIGFRVKCYNEINRIARKTAIILVSHSMPQVGKVCRSGIVMDRGRIVCRSHNIGEVIASYYSRFSHEKASVEGNGMAVITRLRFGNSDNPLVLNDPNRVHSDTILSIDVRKPAICEVAFRVDPSVTGYTVLMSITDQDQKLVAQCASGRHRVSAGSGTATSSVELSSLLLNSGSYTLSVHLMDGSEAEGWTEVLAGIRSVVRFAVKRPIFHGSAPILYTGKWECNP